MDFRKMFALTALFTAMFVQTVATAATIGPVEDFRELITPASGAQLYSTGRGTKEGWDLKDNAMIALESGSPSVNLRGAAYATSATPDFTGDVVITTIYGIDPDPLSAAFRISGFNPAAPEIGSIFDETIVGDSGHVLPCQFGPDPDVRRTVGPLAGL